ncbi:Prophage PssSM-01, Orf22 [Pseudomonas amygdali pv. mori]|uniref:Prophage PssSM-01, Orf22 n=1 Tax=Pseudomonas amygdali pv. mori TaxID=34065 RepID=A0A3M4LC18_PSEA0|nr:hypothetical protein [Pseudomonas amygdali]MDU8571829.1 hypothetical protein [Pseudomonas syringae]RMQ39002.1 Prophage PssSM-01, Orf22 [Pseudomonas amygdali pv. mori]RMR46924.1 Prophage PssSM-01, Orf22 [Pseudomonas amygdali pv. mori]
MPDETKRTDTLNAWLEKREPAAAHSNELVQAHAMALMWLEAQNIRPETVEDALKVTDNYLAVLKECVDVLGGSNLEITATFPDGKVTIEILSR